MVDHEPTMGEVYRLIVSLQQDIRDMRKELIARAEYEADQEGIDRRFQDSTNIHAQLDTKVAMVDAKHTAEIKDVKIGLAAAEKEARQSRSKWILAMVTAAAAAVFSVIASIALQGGAG